MARQSMPREGARSRRARVCLGYPRLGYPSAGIPTEGEGTSTMVVHVPEGKAGYAKAGHGTDG